MTTRTLLLPLLIALAAAACDDPGHHPDGAAPPFDLAAPPADLAVAPTPDLDHPRDLVVLPGPDLAGACVDNAGCGVGYYCEKAVGACTSPGRCVRRPMACDKVYDPACGCDGKTYGNACEAAAAGVNVAARGEC